MDVRLHGTSVRVSESKGGSMRGKNYKMLSPRRIARRIRVREGIIFLRNFYNYKG